MGPGKGALKAPEIARLIADAQHEVKVKLERGAEAFIGPSAFHNAMHQVKAAPLHRLRALVFAPADTGLLARMAWGFPANGGAVDAYLCGVRPVVIAPEMDHRTSSHPAVRSNIQCLREDGCQILEAAYGEMVSAAEIAVEALRGLGGDLSGLKLIVTAGGTREPVDAVRFMGNRSSGKMGLALAREAVKRGACVTMVAANLHQVEPGVEWVPVETAGEMESATRKLASSADVLIMAAAVSDFTPAAPMLSGKIRRGEKLAIQFQPTPDVLKKLKADFPHLFMVGFAATYGDPRLDAREKLNTKGVDLVVGNDISHPGIGFSSDENEVYIVSRSTEKFKPRAPKEHIARSILDAVVSEINADRQV